MNEKQCRVKVAETGRILLEKGLVARTWGNISARVDDRRYAISPSGLGYEHMTEQDVPIYDMEAETWEGIRTPSSENKIHTAAYRNYPEVKFVIHTHQEYATALGLAGIENLKMSEEEKNILGRIEVAPYGLPGSKKLGKNVENAFRNGSKTVLMKHHGAIVLGEDREDTIKKAELLERVCKRTVEEKLHYRDEITAGKFDTVLIKTAGIILVLSTPDVLRTAEEGGFLAQIDDMAQMLGRKLKSVANNYDVITNALKRSDAVLVKNVGCVICSENEDDAQALKMLLKKAAMVKQYTLSCGEKTHLSLLDCLYMRMVYKMKYSKKKEKS